VLLGVTAAVAIDGFAVEPYAIETTHPRATIGLGPPLKIAHVSDLHSHGFGARERRLIAILEDEKPDLIAVTGDSVDTGSLEDAREVFARMRAPLGVWVVRGNWENWKRPAGERVFFASVGATLLVNEGRAAKDGVWIAGVDDPMSGAADLAAATAGAPPGARVIALFHSPAIFDRADERIDVALAGHTHGGQVRVPFAGALWLPPGSGRFEAGWYEHGSARLYVTRGVGMSVLPVRFMCRPEVAIVTLDGRVTR
jgi:predicted MPP superfamily phosphohydrolase